jgi:archaeal flagellar protein FlaJ
MKFQPWLKAYELLNKRVERFYPYFGELHIQLKKGGILIAYKAYIAFMVFVSMLSLIVSTIVSFIVLPLILSNIPHLSVLNVLTSLAVGFSTGIVTIVVMYIYPGMKTSNRKGPIERNLPYITYFLTLLSSSNVPPSTIFKSMSKIDTLKEVRLEFSNIVRDVEIFGNDLMNAIVDNAKLSASDNLRDILVGYVATVRTGGNPTEYLKISSDKVTKERVGKMDVILESLSAMAEIYIMVLVAAPLLFVVLFATLGMIGGGAGFGGMSMSTLLYLLIYIGVPIMGITMMIIMSTFEK